MANTSIYAAFERFWQHIVAALGNKADVNHTHPEIISDPWTLDEDTGCFYRMVGTEREWLNPPLSETYNFITDDGVTGVVVGEYRTAERFGNKPVYTCVIDTGAGVTGSSNAKEFVSPKFRQVPVLVRDKGFAINQTGLEGRALPYFETPSVYWSVHAERDTSDNRCVRIFERSHTSRSSWKVRVQIWYTYETPFND